jgi:SAM-dependent methyltransferase
MKTPKKKDKLSSQEKFLASLSIKPLNPEAGYRKFYPLLKERGIDISMEELGEMEWKTGEPNHIIYASKEIATLVMSTSYVRFLHYLEEFKRLRGFPDKPKKIVELGSAAGIFSLYLAKLFPECQVIAYDWTEEPLEVGRQWALDLGLTNIEFIMASYEEISNWAPTHDCDLVLLYNGLLLPDRPSSAMSSFLNKDAIKIAGSSYSIEIDYAAKAFCNLLKNDGLGIITCDWDELGAAVVMSALEKTDMHIVWDLSVSEITTDPDRKPLWNCYLFIGKKYPEIALSVCEKARALVATAEYGKGMGELSPLILESYSTLFEDGACLLHIEAELQPNVIERIRLLCHGGLLLFENTGTLGLRRGLIQSFFAIGKFIEFIRIVEAKWEQGNAVILKWEVHPSIEELLEYYGLECPPQSHNFPDKAA